MLTSSKSSLSSSGPPPPSESVGVEPPVASKEDADAGNHDPDLNLAAAKRNAESRC